MIKHIVLWKLQEEANGKSRSENALELKRQLENLKGKIPGLIHIEVGINCNKSRSDDEADIVLYSEFEDKKSLEAYLPHPEHQKIVPFARSIRTDRRVIDFEVDQA